jgi:hypothetical protein
MLICLVTLMVVVSRLIKDKANQRYCTFLSLLCMGAVNTGALMTIPSHSWVSRSWLVLSKPMHLCATSWFIVLWVTFALFANKVIMSRVASEAMERDTAVLNARRVVIT